jgi:hypothetical protein
LWTESVTTTQNVLTHFTFLSYLNDSPRTIIIAGDCEKTHQEQQFFHNFNF